MLTGILIFLFFNPETHRYPFVSNPTHLFPFLPISVHSNPSLTIQSISAYSKAFVVHSDPIVSLPAIPFYLHVFQPIPTHSHSKLVFLENQVRRSACCVPHFSLNNTYVTNLRGEEVLFYMVDKHI